MSAATTELTALPRSPSLPTFFDNLDSFAEAPEGVAKLRAFVLDLGVRGKLVEAKADIERLAEAGILKELPNITPKTYFAPEVYSVAYEELGDSE